MHLSPPGMTLINARLSGGEIGCVRIVGARIAAVGGAAQRGDSVVDLDGDRLLPGLINAHDHLQLNSLTRPASSRSYAHAREWIADVDARRTADPEFEAGVAVARDERLLIGGLKNLLSGVTTVAHHDPYYASLSGEYPTRVLFRYGWAHSLYVDGEQKVGSSYRATPRRWPWIIHAAEGVDGEAAQEFERLEALGCLGPNTLLVHGVALGRAQRLRLDRAAAGLIWCPSSNLHLFGKTADVAELAARGRVALGTDSRLSGARDLLEELRLAGGLGVVDDSLLEAMVTRDGARLLRLGDRGELRAGMRADLLIVPARKGLGTASRADVRLVLIDGIVRYGDLDLARRAAPQGEWAEIGVDGRAKILQPSIATLLARTPIGEPGLTLAAPAGEAAAGEAAA